MPLLLQSQPIFPGETASVLFSHPAHLLMLQQLARKPPSEQLLGLVYNRPAEAAAAPDDPGSAAHPRPAPLLPPARRLIPGEWAEEQAEFFDMLSERRVKPTPSATHAEPGATLSWHGAMYGTLVRPAGLKRMFETGGLTGKDMVAQRCVGVERFHVVKPQRSSYGFWYSDLSRITGKHLDLGSGQRVSFSLSTLGGGALERMSGAIFASELPEISLIFAFLFLSLSLWLSLCVSRRLAG